MYSTNLTDAQWDNIKRYLDKTGGEESLVCVQYGMG